MPEAIEFACYGGLSQADQERIEKAAPEAFPNPETAIAWGLEQGAFKALQHARNAYEKLKREQQPQDAQAMAALWVADVQRRLEEMGTGDGGQPGGNGDGVDVDTSQPGEDTSPPAAETSQADPDLEQAFPRYADGTPVGDKPAELAAFEAYYQRWARPPADLDALRDWYKQHARA